jgi:hypothetical protein
MAWEMENGEVFAIPADYARCLEPYLAVGQPACRVAVTNLQHSE